MKLVNILLYKKGSSVSPLTRFRSDKFWKKTVATIFYYYSINLFRSQIFSMETTFSFHSPSL
jgi:hypothetical protein